MKYVIIREPGTRWFNQPYEVMRDDLYLGRTMTLWGAKLEIRRDKRTKAHGKRVVYEENA